MYGRSALERRLCQSLTFRVRRDYVTVTVSQQVQETMHSIEVLFKDGGIFDQDVAADTLFQKTKQKLRDMGVMTYWEGKHQRACSIPTEDDTEALTRTAHQVHELFRAFMKTYFPDYELVNAYACLRLDRKMSLQHRRKLLEGIAVLEGCSADELWILVCFCHDFGCPY